jgi:hypothetical protein
MSRTLCIILSIILAGLSADACWTEQNYLGILNDAQRLVPDNLQKLIDRYSDEFYQGCRPAGLSQTQVDQLIESIMQDTDEAILSFTTRMSYASGTRLLGRIAGSIAHMHALLTDTAKLNNDSWPTDYAIFLQKNRRYFRIRWMGTENRPRNRQELKNVLTRSVTNREKISRILEDNLNRENKNMSEYDTLSAPFGAGSITYSNAVSTIAMTWLYVWDQSGGL